MRIFRPVVLPPPHLLAVEIAQLSHRGRVGSKPVCDDRLGAAVAFERLLHKGESCGFVSCFGDVALKDLTLMVDRAPQIAHLSVHLHVHLIKMPLPLSKASHPVYPGPANVTREQRAEPVPPESHCLVADVDSSFVEQILDVPQRQRVLHVHQHRQADHLG